jgi:hypothetical protein
MDYTFMSTAYDHLDNAQNTMVNWTRNMFEEDDDLRVACDELLTKCRAISTTLDELLNGDDDNDDDDDDSEGDDSDGVRDYWHMSCLVPNFVFQDSSDNILSKIQREAKSRVNMIKQSSGRKNHGRGVFELYNYAKTRFTEQTRGFSV